MALIHCDFFSQVLGLSTSMTVILPQPAVSTGKPAARQRKHPTLYLLHGLSDDHTIWQRRTSIERHVEAMGLAVVMPSVHRSFYTDMASGYRYWTFISEELPALARSFFSLSEARQDNFVAGLSMGGYGAFKLALTYPDRYAAAASLSGALDMAQAAKLGDPTWQAEIRLIFGPPNRVAGSENDLFYLAKQVAAAKGPKPRLYQWCGTEDFLCADNTRFRNLAQTLNLPLTYEECPGDHQWKYWDQQIQRVLDWLPLRRPKSSRKN